MTSHEKEYCGNFAMITLATPSINNQLQQTSTSAGGQWVTEMLVFKQPAGRARKSSLQRALVMNLWLSLHAHTRAHTHIYTCIHTYFSSLKLSIIMHEPLSLYYMNSLTHTHDTSRTGPFCMTLSLAVSE